MHAGGTAKEPTWFHSTVGSWPGVLPSWFMYSSYSGCRCDAAAGGREVRMPTIPTATSAGSS